MVGFANLTLYMYSDYGIHAIMAPYRREAPHDGKAEPRAFAYGPNEFEGRRRFDAFLQGRRRLVEKHNKYANKIFTVTSHAFVYQYAQCS